MVTSSRKVLVSGEVEVAMRIYRSLASPGAIIWVAPCVVDAGVVEPKWTQ